MKTVNSISGGRTSATLMTKHKADYNIFQLVRTEGSGCKFMKGKDEKTRQLISDRIGREFFGTLEEDVIIYTILDLEQYTGQEIQILSADYTYEEMIKQHGLRYLPSPLRRYCTEELKINVAFNWWLENMNNEIVEMRIGYRANEMRRMKKMLNRCNNERILSHKYVTGSKQTKKGVQNVWSDIEWQKPVFPFIEKTPMFKDQIEQFWKDKPVRFAEFNNCVGCFHRDELLLRYYFEKEPEKMALFSSFEKNRKYNDDTLKGKIGVTYERISKMLPNHKLDSSDFSDCDSGYCGL